MKWIKGVKALIIAIAIIGFIDIIIFFIGSESKTILLEIMYLFLGYLMFNYIILAILNKKYSYELTKASAEKRRMELFNYIKPFTDEMKISLFMNAKERLSADQRRQLVDELQKAFPELKIKSKREEAYEKVFREINERIEDLTEERAKRYGDDYNDYEKEKRTLSYILQILEEKMTESQLIQRLHDRRYIQI